MKPKTALLKIVNKVGSIAELGRRLNVSRGHVSNWIAGRRTIPIKKVRELVLLSEGEITKKDLRPDVFNDD